MMQKDSENTRYTEYHAGVAVIKKKELFPPAMAKLAKYEDMEEQGRLIHLPCRLGDTVYKHCKGTESTTCSIMFEGHRYFRETPKVFVGEVPFKLTMIDEIGKTIFLTKETAEEELKKKVEKGECVL